MIVYPLYWMQCRGISTLTVAAAGECCSLILKLKFVYDVVVLYFKLFTICVFVCFFWASDVKSVNGRNTSQLCQNDDIGNLNDVHEILVIKVHFGGVGAIWLRLIEVNMLFYVTSMMLQHLQMKWLFWALHYEDP